MSTESSTQSERRWLRWLHQEPARSRVAAVLIFAWAGLSLFQVLAGEDLAHVALANAPPDASQAEDNWDRMGLNDLRFVAAVLSRNARILVSEPTRLFELEHCHPTPNALALGEPIIASAMLAVPAQIASGDPLVVYNYTLIFSTLLAAGAMYYFMRAWTGVPAAGIVAGLLYAFHTTRMRDPTHFYVWDNAWTLLALVFAQRLFVTARWRDALALAACCAMQIAGSYYPLLVAVLIAVPMLVWFVRVYGLEHVRPSQMVFIVIVCAVTAALVFGPYIGQEASGAFKTRDVHFYLDFRNLSPGGLFYPGIVIIALAGLGMVAPAAVMKERLGSSPKWPLFISLALCFALATGGFDGDGIALGTGGEGGDETAPLWNLWTLMGYVIPGLEVVRSPTALVSGTHVLSCIFAGFGVSAMLRVCPPRYRFAAIAVLIALAYVDTLRPVSLGLEPKQRYTAVPLRPSDEVLDFYVALGEMGNAGPLYELTYPLRMSPRATVPLLAAAYHERPTSVCYNSFVVTPAAALRDRIPEREVFIELHEMGFTTLIMHNPKVDRDGKHLRRDLGELSRSGEDAPLRELLSAGDLSAYQITVDISEVQDAGDGPG